MSVFKKLQSVGSNKPYYGLTKLNIGYHKIMCFRVVKNNFAEKDDTSAADSGGTSKSAAGSGGTSKSIIAELKDQIVFLPQYFISLLTTNEINELNSNKTEKMYLYFGGRRPKSR